MLDMDCFGYEPNGQSIDLNFYLDDRNVMVRLTRQEAWKLAKIYSKFIKETKNEKPKTVK